LEAIFSENYLLLWALVLGVALFFPVRKLIWVFYVRRAQRLAEPDEAESLRLKRRATATAVLVCFLFSILYTYNLFQGQP